ncbi:diguanylate cyclase [Pseudalkalibacillus sp. SCS-8]|uniref:diguanylate cyclase n=1 Tax=Pseudalkalibacillus nanhaiensis TaxID=3115291 RepID=UPI0032DA15D2
MKIIQTVKNPITLYISAICLLGLTVAGSVLYGNFQPALSLGVFALFLAAILLLEFHTILMPPKGNSLSMDSPVYIACLFIFGLEAALQVLLVSLIIFSIFQRKAVWWKHLFNFSNYTLMISGSYFAFKMLGGELGLVAIDNLLPHVVATSVYFLVNVSIIGFYFLIALSGSVKNEVEGILHEAASGYLITLVLSLILCFLIKVDVYVGLVLFTTMGFLLSIAFKQYFTIYQSVSKKANRDFLTGLYNHGYFKELLDSKVQEANDQNKPISMAIIDLDDFKKYNDTFGHLKGDELLQRVGQLIQKESRNNDVVARYGGEEFVILMPDTTENEAYKRMNALRKKMNDTHYDGVEVLPYGCLSFSAGVCQYQEGTSSDFLYRTDQAMYIAKSKGKNMISRYEEEKQEANIFCEEKLNVAKRQVDIFLTKDLMTYRHSNRVHDYAVEFGKRLDLTEKERHLLTLGSIIHDIGKVEIPRELLTKPSKLTSEEWEMMKKHVTWGKDWVQSIEGFEDIIPLVELHHERFDGNGYPYGMKEYSIPKLARILCIVDSFDAMTTERPYQPTKTFEEAFSELRRCAGTQFDPDLVEPFIEMVEECYLSEEMRV